ncbi:ribonuclease HII [Spiroplasma syrphidicola EA-1]|uniref:Ribonuclease HII n=1 Tax=Spiroplasma syrphidicola EA-1 TaxID=1276229 RepID=R4UD68_9MOLU|nr:ribonuclease HII [Spiroplasma syrphidicola]AGM25859.1 ribonuclease HII [Spiroplasma syrphidicola EA-1]
MNKFEQDLLKDNQPIEYLAGTDEAGRGCLAGPLVVGAVILPRDYHNPAIKDSKKLSEKKRLELYDEIINVAISYQIIVMSVKEVEDLNPKRASIVGMERAISRLSVKPDLILTDAEKIDAKFNYIAIIDGDNLSQTIGAASILAKVYRDNLMQEYHQQFPQYHFDQNKGYGTKHHLAMLKEHGYTAIHRKTYQPIKTMVAENLE